MAMCVSLDGVICGPLIARRGARAISEKRLLVLQRAVDDEALDGGIAAAVDGDEGCKLLFARKVFELLALALGHEVALDAVVHPYRRVGRVTRWPVGRARL